MEADTEGKVMSFEEQRNHKGQQSSIVKAREENELFLMAIFDPIS